MRGIFSNHMDGKAKDFRIKKIPIFVLSHIFDRPYSKKHAKIQSPTNLCNNVEKGVGGMKIPIFRGATSSQCTNSFAGISSHDNIHPMICFDKKTAFPTFLSAKLLRNMEHLEIVQISKTSSVCRNSQRSQKH